MQSTIVKDRSPLVGARCRACPRPVRVGQSVLHHKLDARSYQDDRFVVHTECAASLVAEAPEGIPVTSQRAQVARFRQLAEAVAAGADPFAA